MQKFYGFDSTIGVGRNFGFKAGVEAPVLVAPVITGAYEGNSMAEMRLEFAQFGDFDSFSIYRSAASLQVDNLPPPIAVGVKTMFYIDNTIEGGNVYYYRVGVVRGSSQLISDEVAYSVPDSSAGTATETFKFVTENYKSSTNALNINITIGPATGGWSILEAGVLIADSSGFVASGIVRSETADGSELRLGSSRKPSVINYEVIGSLASIKIEHTAATGSPDGAVKVDNFSKNINGYQFKLPNTELTVPNFLPPNITTAYRMFYDATLFNQDISMWDISQLINIESMFNQASSFNQDISSWVPKNVTEALFAFSKATAFNQDLSQWCVPKLTQEPFYFTNQNPNWTLPKPVWGTCPRGEL